MEVIAFITQRHAEGGTSQPNPHIIAFEVPDSIHRTYFLFSQSINQSIKAKNIQQRQQQQQPKSRKKDHYSPPHPIRKTRQT